MFHTTIPNCAIVGPEQAEAHGFVIEGEIAFLFDMGCAMGCLGFNTLDKHWQFDVSPNDEGEVYQFIDGEIRNALVRAGHLTEMVHHANEVHKANEEKANEERKQKRGLKGSYIHPFDHIKLLEGF